MLKIQLFSMLCVSLILSVHESKPSEKAIEGILACNFSQVKCSKKHCCPSNYVLSFLLFLLYLTHLTQ